MNDREKNIETLSLAELIALRDACDAEIAQRERNINLVLTQRFTPLDPAFVRVAASAVYKTCVLKCIIYFVKHPHEHLDPVRHYHMTVHSDDKPGAVYVPGYSSGKPTAEQLAKIAALDAELRALHSKLVNAHPDEM
jgi:hypothetical protein